MPAKISGSAKDIMEEVTNEVLERATLWLWARADELAPRGGTGGNPYARPRKSSSAIGESSIKLDYEIDYKNKIGTVGVPNSMTFIAMINEYGTGTMGSNLFRQFGTETKPQFTIPIIPKNSKVLAWVSSGVRPKDKEGWKAAQREGRARYAKSIKGMNPHPFCRPALHELKTVYLDRIVKEVVKQKFK